MNAMVLATASKGMLPFRSLVGDSRGLGAQNGPQPSKTTATGLLTFQLGSTQRPN